MPMRKRVCKILKTVAVVFAVLFGLSVVVYSFNLDMKLAAQLKKFMDKVYDRRKRDRRL